MSRASAVSVVIPAYNAARYLDDAIQACLAQTLPAHEIIVVDDGSHDATPEICTRYSDRIITIRQANKGEAGARNAAVAIATGEFIALLDADDVCATQRLERQVAALQSAPRAIVCYSGHWVFNDEEITGRFPGDPTVAARPAEDFAADLLVHPITMMFRRRAAQDLKFPVGVYTGGDMIFSGLLRRRGEVVVVPDVLYGYRRHAAQITASGHDLDSLRYRLAWMQQHSSEWWPELDVAQWEVRAWHAMARALQLLYWARRRTEFLRFKQVLNENWPSHVPRVAELNLRWYPSWLWQLKGAIDKFR